MKLELTAVSKDEVVSIHEATLRILAETGIVLTLDEGREILAGEGATIQGERVLIPADTVERLVGKCPKLVRLRGRGGGVKTLGDGSHHWHNLGGARDILDVRRGIKRGALIRDVCESARVLDALDSVTTITPFFTPQDVAGELMSLAMYRHTLPNTVKPVHGPGVQTADEVHLVTLMAETLGPPHEYLSLSVSPVSPLTFPDDGAKAILEIARNGIPFAPLPCPTAGTTAPLTIAGALTQQNAEVLASIIIAQAVHPGLPIVYCGRLAMMEPRSGISVWGGVELGLASAGTVAIGHLYNLPVNVYGFSTNSHTLDLQSGFERSLNAVIPALAGADELSGIGEMEAGVMGSHAQMVIDNEIAASVRRLRQGFEVDEDKLAVEIIAAVMNGSHNFLGQKHTKQYLKAGEILVTRLAERRTWETWEREGREDMAERAQAEAERILNNHEVEPLTTHQERELDMIMASALKTLVDK